MARGDGIRYGAGGKPMTTLKEVVGESNETEIKCILSSFTFEESNIFLKSYNELIKNVNIIFQDSIKESNDEHEKRLLKKSLEPPSTDVFLLYL